MLRSFSYSYAFTRKHSFCSLQVLAHLFSNLYLLTLVLSTSLRIKILKCATYCEAITGNHKTQSTSKHFIQRSKLHYFCKTYYLFLYFSLSWFVKLVTVLRFFSQRLFFYGLDATLHSLHFYTARLM